MKNKRSLLLLWVLALLPACVLLAVYSRLPETLPTSYGFNGQVNAYGPRATLWLFPALALALAAMFQFLPWVDPRKDNFRKFQKYYDLFALFMELFLLVVLCLMLLQTLRPGTISMGRCLSALISLLFLLLGNMMGKVKFNYFFGIRTPWTLADPDVWTRTHALGGKLWFTLGILLLPSSFLLPESFLYVLMLGGLALSSLLLYALSYHWYRTRPAAQ